MEEEGVGKLRAGLISIDRSLVDLIAARMNLVKILGTLKSRIHAPVQDELREIIVASILAEEAERKGLPAGLVRDIYFELARWSKCMQVYCPLKSRIAIYGYGSMASMIASMLARAGCWLAVTGRDYSKAAALAEKLGAEAMEDVDAIEWADIMLYAIPSTAFPEVLERHWSRLRESMLILDISSVKKPVVEAYKRLAASREPPEYASLHPLYGPLECPAGETIAVTPVNLDAWKEKLEDLLSNALAARIVYVDAETHDKVMAVNQVLHHFALQAVREAMREAAKMLGVEPADLKELTTHSLRRTLSLIDRLESLERVVEEIRRENPYSSKAIEAFVRVVERLASQLGGSGHTS
ncbi:MAG: prephenate dehydrogenase/arogenate dehydrogenase family protein [Crenarchaeota archaeon]|nr:prephenate dehydrogenase/arogenate dehydrogenase family protein [Thermoproteota archaeon]